MYIYLCVCVCVCGNGIFINCMLASVMFSIAYCLKYFYVHAIVAVRSNPVFRQFVPLHGQISKSVLLKDFCRRFGPRFGVLD